MIGELGDRHGWIEVKIEKPADWKSPTFFPLVDATFKAITEEYDKNPRAVLFDVSQLEFIDSTMVSLFLQAARLTGATRNAVVVTHEHTRDLLSLLGIDKLVDIFDSIQDWENSLSDS